MEMGSAQTFGPRHSDTEPVPPHGKCRVSTDCAFLAPSSAHCQMNIDLLGETEKLF